MDSSTPPIDSSTSLKAPPLWNSCRLTFTICAFTAVMNLMFVKLNLTFALVCMVQSGNKNTNTSKAASFDWDKQTQGHLLSAFFYGYLLALLVGGWLSQKKGAKKCLVFGNAAAAILNFLIPAAAFGGAWYLYAIRFLQGIFMGIMLPSIQFIFSSWTHADERTKLVTHSFIGYTVGIVLVNPISSLFCYSNKEMGWSFIFYFTGTIMSLCAIAYYFVVFDSVHIHPRISNEEKDYILSGLSTENDKKAIPYKSIFTSMPAYAYFITHGCQVFGYAALSVTYPLFLKEAAKVTVIENGLLSAVPSILSTITRFVIGQIFTPMHRFTKLSLTRFRKVNHAIGSLVPAATFFAVTFMSDYKIAIIVILSLVESVCDLGYCGSYVPSVIDFAPNFAGFLSGVSTAVANLPFIAVAQIFGYLTREGTPEEWNILWYVCSGTYIFGCIFYVSFGTSVKQHWG